MKRLRGLLWMLAVSFLIYFAVKGSYGAAALTVYLYLILRMAWVRK